MRIGVNTLFRVDRNLIIGFFDFVGRYFFDNLRHLVSFSSVALSWENPAKRLKNKNINILGDLYD